MKKFVPLVTAVVLSASLVTGCSSQGTDSVQTAETAEESETESEAVTENKAYIEDGKIYIFEDGKTYPYNFGIYEDENGYYIYPYDIPSDDDPDVYKKYYINQKTDTVFKCDEDISSLVKSIQDGTCDNINNLIYEEDMIGQKLYYPADGVQHDNDTNEYYVISENGHKYILEGYTPAAEQPEVTNEADNASNGDSFHLSQGSDSFDIKDLGSDSYVTTAGTYGYTMRFSLTNKTSEAASAKVKVTLYDYEHNPITSETSYTIDVPGNELKEGAVRINYSDDFYYYSYEVIDE